MTSRKWVINGADTAAATALRAESGYLPLTARLLCSRGLDTAEKVAAWIDGNCHTAITETQIATQFGYNADYLNRLFKSSFSKSIKQYINERRIEYIKGLMLRSELPLKEIAIRSGFDEYKYFLKFFKYHEKITPTEFHKQYAKMHINSQ